MVEARLKVLVVLLWREKPGSSPLVLCLRRPASDGAFWQTVTGGVDEGERPADAALRELREETGIDQVSPPAFLGIEHRFEGRWGPAVERAYMVECFSTSPPSVTLDPKEHDSFEWLVPQEAMDRVKFPVNRDAICRAAFPPSPLVLNCEGEWSQDGQAITHQRSVEFLHANLRHSSDGRYYVHSGEETLPVIVEDVARFAIALLDNGTIRLRDGRLVPLDPSRLYFGAKNILYTKIDAEAVRFNRSTQYALLQKADEKLIAGKTQYILHWLGRDYLLPTGDEN